MSNAYQTILCNTEDLPILKITLNLPKKRNPISSSMLAELGDALAKARDDKAVQVIVLTGAGKVFSAGGDLSQLSSAANPSRLPAVSLVDLLERIHDLGKPLVAMVNGHALAGGLGLMVACDVVVASDQARFGTTEIKVGLWPMMITAELTRNIGRKKTLDLMLTGRQVGADEALAMGLITRMVPPTELLTATMELASELAAKSPTILALGLRSFYATQDMGFGESLRSLESGLGQVLATDDAREGIMAFLQKRPPVWKNPPG